MGKPADRRVSGRGRDASVAHIYGMIAAKPTRVDCALVRAQEALIRSGFTRSRNVPRPTGWGACLFLEEGIRASRSPVHNPYDKVVDRSLLGTEADGAIAHVRHGTAGKPDRRNTHPFVHGTWAFAHHGAVENFQTIRRELTGEMTPELRRAVKGTTDSEHIFYLFLSYLKRSAGSIAGDAPINRIRDAFEKTVVRLNEWSERTGSKVCSSLVMVACNRQVLLACRQRGPLHILERETPRHCPVCGTSHVSPGEEDSPCRSVIVASEPFTGEEWGEVPDGNLLLIDPDLSVSCTPIRIE